MSRYSASEILSYSCEQLFDIAAGIEQYPEFLPGWIDAQITEHSDACLHVQQSLGFGLLQMSFRSMAVIRRPYFVHVSSADGPFQSLEVEWHFIPLEEGFCRVSLDIEMVIKHPALGRLADRVFDASSQKIMARFCQRAHDLYRKDQAE